MIKKDKKILIVVGSIAIVVIIALIIAFSGKKYEGRYYQYYNKDSYAPKYFEFEDKNSGYLLHASGILFSFTYSKDTNNKVTIDTKSHLGTYTGEFLEEEGELYFILDVWDVKYKKD